MLNSCKFAPLRILRLSFFCATFALLSGCGSGPTTVPQTLPALTGNWQIQSSGSAPNLGLVLSGSLVNKGSVVTANMLLSDLNSPNSCGISTPVTFTGTLSFDQGIVMQSQPFGGSVVTVALELSATANAILTGTIGVTGSACSYPEAPAVGAEIAALDGTFTGSVASSNALQTQTVSLTLTQDMTPNANGQFPVTGSLQVTGSFCNSTYPLSGFANGTYLNIAAPVDTTGNAPASVIAYSNTQGTQLSDSQFLFADGPCSSGLLPYDTYTGTLTRH